MIMSIIFKVFRHQELMFLLKYLCILGFILFENIDACISILNLIITGYEMDLIFAQIDLVWAFEIIL